MGQANNVRLALLVVNNPNPSDLVLILYVQYSSGVYKGEKNQYLCEKGSKELARPLMVFMGLFCLLK